MTSPQSILTAWNMTAKKQLGQNFLSDPSIPEMIVRRAAIGSGDTILEIGAGFGALTIPAARAAGRLFPVEADREVLVRLNAELLAAGLAHITPVKADILEFDIPGFLREQGVTEKITVMGNLPYHISSRIVIRLMAARSVICRAVLMFQQEMARRLAARPGSREYGRLGAMLAYCGTAKSLAVIGASRFHPRPKVDSEVLDIRFFDTPPTPARDEAFLFATIKAAFGRRRKTVKNSLAGSELPLDGPQAARALSTAGINPSRRAETLDTAEFVALSHALADVLHSGAARE